VPIKCGVCQETPEKIGRVRGLRGFDMSNPCNPRNLRMILVLLPLPPEEAARLQQRHNRAGALLGGCVGGRQA
jgi:hypothetical protein